MAVPVLAGIGPGGQPDEAVARQVAAAWRHGGVVGLPTETVYGLAADAQDRQAVARVYRIKGRPPGHPLIAHVSGPEALAGWASGPVPVAQALAEAFWPGPLTVIVARSARAGDFLTGGQPSVALRCPAHPVALACLRALAEASGDPARAVAAPSANRFGQVSPTTAADVLAEVGQRLDPARDLVVDGGPCVVGVESTIVDCTGPPRILRAGAIGAAEVLGAVGADAAGASAGSSPRPSAGPVRAPGMLPSHYAPAARVVLVEQDRAGAGPLAQLARSRGVGGPVGLIAAAPVPTPAGWLRLAAPGTPADYARELYAALRRADRAGLRTVVAVLPPAGGGPLAIAVRDRLARAAADR